MLNWGTVADQYNYCEGPPSYGVACRVRSGVTYVSPPPEGGGFREWHPSPHDMLRFVMPLGDDPVMPPYWTLDALATSVRERAAAASEGRGTLAKDAPELDRLDWVVDQLFEVAKVLRDEENWLGRVHPENALLLEYGGPGDRELILSDWGFAFNSGFIAGLGGAPPAWVSSSPWAVVWDYTPTKMNEAVLQGGRPEEKGVDRRSLARLLVCLLEGRETVEAWCKTAPRSKRGGSRLNALPEDSDGTRGDLWVKLDEALQDKIALEELAGFVRENPLSSYFLGRVEAGLLRIAEAERLKRARWKQRAAMVGIGVPLLLAGVTSVGIVLYKSGVFDPLPEPPFLCPTCPGDSPIVPGLDALEEARKKGPDAEVAALTELHALPTKDGRSATVAEAECLAMQRGETLAHLEADYKQLKEALEGKPGAPEPEGQRIDDLLKRTEAVTRLDSKGVPPPWVESLKFLRRYVR